VRTVVVLPVPPFWERTAIVTAIESRTIDPPPVDETRSSRAVAPLGRPPLDR